jgi:hypothetical protein
MRGGGIFKFFMVQWIERNAFGLSVHDTKTVHNG